MGVGRERDEGECDAGLNSNQRLDRQVACSRLQSHTSTASRNTPAPPPQVDPDIQAPELLQRLFELGTDLLVRAGLLNAVQSGCYGDVVACCCGHSIHGMLMAWQ